MRLLFLIPLAAGMLSAATVPGIVSFTSNLVFPTTTPSSLVAGQVQSDTRVFGYVEKIAYVLTQAVPVGIVNNGPALYNDAGDLLTAAGSLPVGMMVNSYFLHFDPATNTLLPSKNPGIVEIAFNPLDRIAGIQLGFVSFSAAGSSQLKIPGVTYSSAVLTGLELIANDSIELVNDYTVRINMNVASTTLDEVRILVETPEPSYALLIAPAIGLLLWFRRRTAATAPHKL